LYRHKRHHLKSRNLCNLYACYLHSRRSHRKKQGNSDFFLKFIQNLCLFPASIQIFPMFFSCFLPFLAGYSVRRQVFFYSSPTKTPLPSIEEGPPSDDADGGPWTYSE